MKTITVSAHFDGEYIQLDEPFELTPNVKLLITILPAEDGDREEWYRASLQGLNLAYGDDEPEYSLNTIKEANSDYEGR